MNDVISFTLQMYVFFLTKSAVWGSNNESGVAVIVRNPAFRVMIAVSVDRDVFVDVLAAYEGVVEQVEQHGDDEPVAAHVAERGGEQVVLHERHDTAADHEHHEDTRSLLGVFAEAFDSKVEDTAPHERRA